MVIPQIVLVLLLCSLPLYTLVLDGRDGWVMHINIGEATAYGGLGSINIY